MESTAAMREEASTFTAQRWESEFTTTILSFLFYMYGRGSGWQPLILEVNDVVLTYLSFL